MASGHASGHASEQDQDIIRLISSLECDMAVQTGVLKQYAKLQDVVKAFLEEKMKITHEKQEVERLHEELSNKNKELSLEIQNLQGVNQLLSRENQRLNTKEDKFSRANKDLNLKLTEKLVETESPISSIFSGHTQGVQTRSMSSQKVQECVKGTTADDDLKEELFDPVLTNRIIAEDCERRRELFEIRKKLIEVFGDIDHNRHTIKIKMMGQIDRKSFLDAAYGKHPRGMAKVVAAENCLEWQQKIQDPAWHPYKRIIIDGLSEMTVRRLC